ncbi:MAG TPA: hypothetical protein VE988_22760 [Gemmataceae bacterium]|nr:hypothetical protein [Gemmataceae bacterium]
MPQTVDVSGLPGPVIDDIQRLILTLRCNLPASSAAMNPSALAILEEVERDLDALAEASPPSPVLPVNFSRDDIYSDHD